MRNRALRSGTLLLVFVTAFGACDDETRGGADALPGSVPPGVTFSAGESSAPPAPDFSLTLMDGTRVSGSELWGQRPVVLFFFAPWCEPCADQNADLMAIGERYGDAVVLLGVAGEDEAAAVTSYLEDNAVSHAAAIDADLDMWRNYAVREPPHVVIIAKGGRVIRGWPGGTTRALIEETLAELVIRTT